MLIPDLISITHDIQWLMSWYKIIKVVDGDWIIFFASGDANPGELSQGTQLNFKSPSTQRQIDISPYSLLNIIIAALPITFL